MTITVKKTTNINERLVVFRALYQLVYMGICFCLQAICLLSLGERSLVGLLILLT